MYKVKNERTRSSWPQDGAILADFWGFWIFSNDPSCGQNDLVLLMSKIFQIATKNLSEFLHKYIKSGQTKKIRAPNYVD
jgi:hypothetical protein